MNLQNRSIVLALVVIMLGQVGPAQAGGNEKITRFRKAKNLISQIHQAHRVTLYCGCQYVGTKVNLTDCGYVSAAHSKRASKLEWEHVVPAEAFGSSFDEWKKGAPSCKRKSRRYKGRKCARHNPKFSLMEADLYNLWPAVGELNGLRSNFSMAELGAEKSPKGDFGACRARVKDHKFEPMPQAKGIVARTYLYMDQAYPGRGIISQKNKKLFEAWDKLHPVSEWECLRAKKIESIQGNVNPVLSQRCASGTPTITQVAQVPQDSGNSVPIAVVPPEPQSKVEPKGVAHWVVRVKQISRKVTLRTLDWIDRASRWIYP